MFKKLKLNLKSSTIILLAVIILILEFVYYFLIKEYYDSEVDRYLEEKTLEAEIKVNSVVTNYHLVSDVIFNELINRNDILQLYSKAYTSDKKGQEIIREKLFKMLEGTYKSLKTINIKQHHFHLPDNRSFLRFHRPDKYGDDLTKFRYSVRITNKEKQKHFGFEEGKIFNGFRAVYPLFYNNTHIGSVEVSLSFEAIKYQLELLGIKHSSLAISKVDVFGTVFSEELNNYEPAIFSNAYLIEKEFSHYKGDARFLLKTIDKNISNQIEDKLKNNSSFSVYSKVKNDYYTINFVSLKNLENKPIAYIVTYIKDNTLEKYFNGLTLTLLTGLILIPLLTILLYKYFENNRKIRKQNIELKKINADKDRFFSILAHDLKNPFMGLLGLTEMLTENVNEFSKEDIHKYMSLLYSQSKSTYDLLEELLLWSKSQSGKLPFNKTKINVKTLCNEVTGIFLNNSKNISLQCNMDESLEVEADANMLKTILRNLISNAIKFSFKNSEVKVEVKKDKKQFIFSVSDKGVGIKEEDIAKIWDISKKFTTNGTEGEKGTGLGLILCREFVEKHNGKIWVESKIGEGTTFYFTIPE